jgi:light-regulated signal transduction histidine kinase (bacteriophytochrome)
VGPEPVFEISSLPRIGADPTLLRQVWANLISNALKYRAKRELPTIKISGRVENDEAIYQVEDNGAGFDMRYAERLFGVFQRLHRTEDFAGTGVGLAIAHCIVTRRGGRIWGRGILSVERALNLRCLSITTDVARRSLAKLQLERFGPLRPAH